MSLMNHVRQTAAETPACCAVRTKMWASKNSGRKRPSLASEPFEQYSLDIIAPDDGRHRSERSQESHLKSTISTLMCLLLMGVASPPSRAANKPEGEFIQTITSGIPHSALFGISFDAGTGVAVGINGSVLTTGDGGATWTPVKQDATDLALLAVERRGSHTIAVGQLGVAITETAPGQWKKADTGVEGRLLSVSVNSSGLAVAGG
ncbi:MAG TPA: hypothetical protein VFK72_02900, partial [Nevskia sp.]|nr:hypothetical protein [Nevskia sp.]